MIIENPYYTSSQYGFQLRIIHKGLPFDRLRANGKSLPGDGTPFVLSLSKQERALGTMDNDHRESVLAPHGRVATRPLPVRKIPALIRTQATANCPSLRQAYVTGLTVTSVGATSCYPYTEPEFQLRQTPRHGPALP